MDESNHLELETIDEWDGVFWGYNMPLQFWRQSDGTARVLNYMPRKERCAYLDKSVSKDDMQRCCVNTAKILRNLASLIEAFGRGELDTVYYPDEWLLEAVRQCEEDRMESSKDK